MSESFQTSRRVEFRDTDAAGIMHFAAILGTMEEAEHAMLRHLDLPLFRPVEGGEVSWPRVSVQADFLGPARFEEVLTVDVVVNRLGKRSVTYGFHLSVSGRDVATGSMTSACCLVAEGSLTAMDVPESVRETLTPYLRAPS